MNNPTLRIIRNSALAQIREVVNVSDREEAKEVYRAIMKIAQEISKKHKFNFEKVKQ